MTTKPKMFIQKIINVLKKPLLHIFKKRYYCIKQHDITDCGAACLATISKQYGLKMPISKIREVAGTDKQGTNAYGVIKAAEKLGFTAKGVKGDMESIFSAVAKTTGPRKISKEILAKRGLISCVDYYLN